MTPEDLATLADARRRLSRRGLMVRLTEKLGRPIERGMAMLPEAASRRIQKVTKSSLERALRVALTTLSREGGAASERRHKLAGAASGAMGGWFGLAGLAVELPVTTVIMLRSIADVARSEGHDLDSVDVRLACLEVFALGGPAPDDDAAETGYFAVRAALASAFADAAKHLAAQGVAREGAPALVRLVERVALRFGVVVQDKVLLEAVPILGAASGALINTVFLAHFQDVARGHFTIRRLERKYGADAVRASYEALGRPGAPLLLPPPTPEGPSARPR
jgi:hypothetical protein